MPIREAESFIESLSAEQVEAASHIAFDQFRARHPTIPLTNSARSIFLLGFSAGVPYGADLALQVQVRGRS